MWMLWTLLACAHRAPQSTGGVEGELVQCPAFDIDPPTCSADTAGRGETLELPWEWGWAAAGNALWFDRLACADGSSAVVDRIGSFGAAPVPSKAPSSGAPGLGVDILDRYQVQCPGQPVVLWYTNVYRCGDLCVPAPFKVLPAAAASEMTLAMRALDEHEEVDALRHAQAVVDRAPDFELSWLARGYVQMVANDPQGAVESAAQACERFPASAWASPLGDLGCKAGVEACCPPPQP